LKGKIKMSIGVENNTHPVRNTLIGAGVGALGGVATAVISTNRQLGRTLH
jgi:hypothetical protein